MVSTGTAISAPAAIGEVAQATTVSALDVLIFVGWVTLFVALTVLPVWSALKTHRRRGTPDVTESDGQTEVDDEAP